ncbi:MAG: hypothetical protein KAH84_03115 [Thiomargarita sp.]|nr:hypothetical protein [Thiomargarita sp.]
MSDWCVAECDTESVFNFRDLYQAWLDCRKNKRITRDAQRYEIQALDNLFNTLFRLRQHTYVPTTSICFIAKKPKMREIHAAAFQDRVVHHWLVPRLSQLFEPVFIYDLYSNRLGKGTHKAVFRLQYFMRSLQASGQSAYYLQLDIHNFFNSINKPILFHLLQKRLVKAYRQGKIKQVQAETLRWLSRVLLKHDTVANTYYVGTSADFSHIPQHKRLACGAKDNGLPIGNLTSQFFANVYLNELDQFIKHQLKCRYYLRYVDDFVLLHQDVSQLKNWYQQIENFVEQQLQLTLKSDYYLRPINDGANFLGYIIRPHYCLVRRRVVGNLVEKLTAFEQIFFRKTPSHKNIAVLRLYRQPREQLYATLNSYLGHFQHASYHNLVKKIFHKYAWLNLLFDWQADHKNLIPLWQPPIVTSYLSQVSYFRAIFPNACLYIQRGREVDRFNRFIVNNKHIIMRHQVVTVHIREAGYLKCGKKRRLVTSLSFYRS